jgi:nitronate monooxygenase
MEREGKTIKEIGPLVAGVRGKVVYETGDLDHGVWSAGMVQGLIHDIPSCKGLIERFVSEAAAIIRKRLDPLAA